jgi:hypothetical protein
MGAPRPLTAWPVYPPSPSSKAAELGEDEQERPVLQASAVDSTPRKEPSAGSARNTRVSYAHIAFSRKYKAKTVYLEKAKNNSLFERKEVVTFWLHLCK